MGVDYDLSKWIFEIHRLADVRCNILQESYHRWDSRRMNAIFGFFKAQNPLYFRVPFKNAKCQESQSSIG